MITLITMAATAVAAAALIHYHLHSSSLNDEQTALCYSMHAWSLDLRSRFKVISHDLSRSSAAGPRFALTGL